MKVDKFYVYTSVPFPYGLAPTNRIIAYAKGFLHHGKDVEVVCFCKTEQPGKILNYETQGTYQGITFRYLATATARSKTFIKRRMDNAVIHVRLIRYSFKTLNPTAAIIYYAPNTLALLLLKIVAKIKGARIYKEQSEHPDVHMKSTRIFLSGSVYKYFHYGLVDGLFLMTRNLVSYFEREKFTTKAILHVPMTVEVDRFSRTAKQGRNSKEIMYTGMLDDRKDGTDVLIKAFARISLKYPEYHLSLYGAAASESESRRYKKMADELAIGDKVHFHGLVSRDRITKEMLDAAILVLPRPDSIQAQNGFPTKLGEYLASGVPVIATAVGEIPYYLKDNESVFMADPGNVESLVEKLDLIISNYEMALKVAKQGQLVANENFSNIRQTDSIISFVERNA